MSAASISEETASSADRAELEELAERVREHVIRMAQGGGCFIGASLESPVAQAFGTQNGSGSSTNTMSGAQQFATIAGGIGSLFPKNPIKFS